MRFENESFVSSLLLALWENNRGKYVFFGDPTLCPRNHNRSINCEGTPVFLIPW